MFGWVEAFGARRRDVSGGVLLEGCYMGNGLFRIFRRWQTGFRIYLNNCTLVFWVLRVLALLFIASKFLKPGSGSIYHNHSQHTP